MTLPNDKWREIPGRPFHYEYIAPLPQLERPDKMIAAAIAPNRPADITLPKGWTWERVEAERAKWGIADNMVPCAVAIGCVAWGTINSVRNDSK